LRFGSEGLILFPAKLKTTGISFPYSVFAWSIEKNYEDFEGRKWTLKEDQFFIASHE